VQPDDASLRKRLAQADADDRVDLLMDRMASDVAEALGIDTAEVDVDQGLFSLGLSSLAAVQLKQRLEALVGFELSDTVIFNYPCIRDLAGYLSSRLAGAEAAPAAAPDVDAEEDDLLARLERKLGRRP